MAKSKQKKSSLGSNKHTSKKVHTLHKPHIHLSFSVIVLIIFVCLSIGLILMRPVSYSSLKSVSSQDGSFSIEVPELMDESYRGENRIVYEHRVGGKDSGLIAHVRAESQSSSPAEMTQKKHQIIQQLKEGKGPFYEALTGDSEDSSLADSMKFSNFQESEVSNAYAADFSYESNQNAVNGKMMVVFDDAEIYVITTEATSDVWASNQATWNEVLDSFKVEK